MTTNPRALETVHTYEMCEWTDEENMQLNKTQVSTASGDKNKPANKETKKK